MATITQLQPAIDQRTVRAARAAFVRDAIASDDRSARYVALRLGVAPSTMNDRLAGKTPFLADDIAAIAEILKRDPLEFYAGYLAAGDSNNGPSPKDDRAQWAQRGSNPRPTD